MPRRLALAVLLILPSAPSTAQPAADPAEQAVIDANRAIREHNDRIAAENAAAQAAYRDEVARAEAQRQANAASFAAATAAFQARQAQYDADMARWREDSARVAAQARAPARPAPVKVATKDAAADDGRPVCRRSTVTGSMMPGPRICKTQREWDREARQ